MGTVTNGKKWAGACVNGKTVSGLAKNGVVFYRMPVSTYKRRIMVGDNLSNRTIFQDFPDGFYKSGMSSGEQFNLIESNNINIFEYYFGDSVSGTYEVYGGNRTDSNLLYRYDVFFGRTMTKKDVTTDTYLNATVTEVNENATYRHLFIEDENIRPLEVGDVITSNTKFYFTFPDDFKSFITSPILSSKLIIQLDNSNTGFRVDDSYLDSSAVMATIATTYGYTPIRPFIYEYENDTNTLLQNGSYRINMKTGNKSFSGTVTYIDKTDSAYQHILVDTTTLGV